MFEKLFGKDPLVLVDAMKCERCVRVAESLGEVKIGGEAYTLWRCPTEHHDRYNDAQKTCSDGGSFWAVDENEQHHSEPELKPHGYKLSVEAGKAQLIRLLERRAERKAKTEASYEKTRSCVDPDCEAFGDSLWSRPKCGACGAETKARNSFVVRCDACGGRPLQFQQKKGHCRCGGRFIAKFNDGGAK
jgi:hypothetical protein